MLMAMLLIVPMLLAACGGSDMDPADAERGLEAFIKGDWEEAEKYICEEEIDTARNGNDDGFDPALIEGIAVDAVCEKDGDAMSCVVSVNGLASPAIRANIDDGKLCGLDE